LIGEWGFRGFVVSDWNATAFTTTEGCVNAGLSLEMPTRNVYKVNKMQRAFDEGKFTLEYLDDNVRRLLRVMFLVGKFDKTYPPGSRNTPEHQAIARKTAENGMVLLKNQGNLLPLDYKKIKKLAVIGPNATLKTSQGGGSSTNFPPYEITPLEGIKEKCRDNIEIVDSPSEADVIILFVGLNHDENMDAEHTDKISFKLPSDQIQLIKESAKLNPNTIVVLISGSPISMSDWIDEIPAVLEAWYGGMEAGHVIADILFGDVNPSGKLPITFPKALSDSPAHVSSRTFPGDEKVFYDEGIFVGYRHFDTKGIEPLFPFGYGLSYTEFKYENLRLNSDKLKKDEILEVTVDIVNSGKVSGAEIIQLYINDVDSSVERPLKELKGFRKVFLKPNERVSVLLQIMPEDLAFFDEGTKKWKIENGVFKILIASSSRDIRLTTEFEYIDK
jgi:beta-glucosidase